MNNLLKLFSLLITLLLFSGKNKAQSVVILDDCGVSYIDPQDASGSTSQSQDTLLYTTSFEASNMLRSYHVDINAFGGQQVDRTQVFALLPDMSKKLLGQLAFGTCSDCVNGFALVYNDSLYVESVTDQNSMEMWLLAFNQPEFRLPGNLQTLNGVGRISGTIPPCAIGLEVQYIVFSDPQNTTTEFSTHVLCPEILLDCTVLPTVQIDCPNDSIYLNANIPQGCYAETASIRWSHPNGTSMEGAAAAFALSGNEGYFYLTIEDACCTLLDSVWIENPDFAQAGPDTESCQGTMVELLGSGGIRHFWEYPDGSTVDSSLATFIAVEAADAGTYILHAFNEEGCEDTDTLQLTVPVPPVPEILLETVCIGETLSLSVGNDSMYSELSWLRPDNSPLAQAAIPNLQVSDFGLYTLRATDLFGCIIEQTFEVNGDEPPAYEYLFSPGCDTTTVVLFPETYTYNWETGDTGAVFYTKTGGIYTLSITDPLGCTTVDQLDIPPPDDLAVAINLEHPQCPTDFGAIEILVDDKPFIFSIDGGQNYFLTPYFDRVVPDTYEIVIQDAIGCVKRTTVEIFKPDTLGVDLGIDSLVLRPNTPVSLLASTVGNVQEYQWIPEDIDTKGPSTEFLAQKDKDIRIVVRDERGCHASDGLQLFIVLGDIYAPNAFSPDGNGINDYFTFYSDNGSGEIIEVLRIFDRYGALIFEANEIPLNQNALGWDGTFNGEAMNAGVMTYFGRVRFGNGTKKILKGEVHLMR